MLRLNNKKIKIIRFAEKSIAAVITGANVVFGEILSCFGSGRWRQTLTWRGFDRWKS